MFVCLFVFSKSEKQCGCLSTSQHKHVQYTTFAYYGMQARAKSRPRIIHHTSSPSPICSFATSPCFPWYAPHIKCLCLSTWSSLLPVRNVHCCCPSSNLESPYSHLLHITLMRSLISIPVWFIPSPGLQHGQRNALRWRWFC